jgi:hypothetical protein
MAVPTSTFGLLERIRQGDRTAFDALFEKHRRRLTVLIYYKLDRELRRFADVDDVLQETLLRAFRSLDTFEYRTPGSFLHWLSRIADPRTDIFSLGTILYELLTGATPFRGEGIAGRIRGIREQDPVLPRRINPAIPGELQNICLKALEKNPADRYAGAREMANDLERYLAGEPVLANPTAYSRLTATKVEQHLRELEAWRNDHILSDYEFDSFRKAYDRLNEKEDAWIMEVRRLSLPQVVLYLGNWLLVVGAALIALFRYAGVTGTPAVLLVSGVAAATVGVGIRTWKSGEARISLAWLLAFCLVLPLAMLIAMHDYGLFAGWTRGDRKLEFFSRLDSLKPITNAQFWWAILLSLPAYYWLRRLIRASVFSLALALGTAALCMSTLLRMGMLDWIDNDPGRFYFHLLPCAAFFMTSGYILERIGQASDSRYFYPIAVLFTLAALSGVAAEHKPYADWLKSAAPWTRGQVEYLFILNAVAYFSLQALCERFPTALPHRGTLVPFCYPRPHYDLPLVVGTGGH